MKKIILQCIYYYIIYKSREENDENPVEEPQNVISENEELSDFHQKYKIGHVIGRGPLGCVVHGTEKIMGMTYYFLYEI